MVNIAYKINMHISNVMRPFLSYFLRYENDQEFTRFTPLQLAEIRKMTIAALFCNNLDNIYTIQRAVLDLPDPFM